MSMCVCKQCRLRHGKLLDLLNMLCEKEDIVFQSCLSSLEVAKLQPIIRHIGVKWCD